MFPQIRIGGEPQERGRRYGQATARLVRLSIANYARLFAYLRGIDWATAQHEALEYVPVLERFAPDLLAEMHGIAVGAELDVATILALNVRTELIAGKRRDSAHPDFAAALERNRGHDVPQPSECTTVAALPPTTASGTPLLAQTWDWYGSQRAACVLLRVDAPGRPAILTLTEAGMVAKIGLNSAGVGVSLNILATDQDGLQIGMPVHVQLRRVLETRSVAEALERVDEVRAAASSCITVVDKGGTAVSLEVTPYGAGRLMPVDGLLVHTNHCLTELTAPHQRPIIVAGGTEPRFDRATELLRASAGRIDRDTLIGVLRDHEAVPTGICRHTPGTGGLEYQAESVTGVIMDVAAGVMHVAPGIPCEVPFEPIALDA